MLSIEDELGKKMCTNAYSKMQIMYFLLFKKSNFLFAFITHTRHDHPISLVSLYQCDQKNSPNVYKSCPK